MKERYCFVEFYEEAHAASALQEMQGYNLNVKNDPFLSRLLFFFSFFLFGRQARQKKKTNSICNK
jgi:hypothetical protein